MERHFQCAHTPHKQSRMRSGLALCISLDRTFAPVASLYVQWRFSYFPRREMSFDEISPVLSDNIKTSGNRLPKRLMSFLVLIVLKT